MDILKFTISGKTAFFKKPEVNEYAYFTFGNIHKVALFGMLGAIMGYSGYSQMLTGQTYPQFYERLKNLKVGIVPHGNGNFMKKVHIFNNSVGYASLEKGNNLIIRQQWLHNPKWDIYILMDNEESILIANALHNQECIYNPYLGANNHFADISHVEIIKDAALITKVNHVDSLCPTSLVEFKQKNPLLSDNAGTFKYVEYLPVGINEELNQYMMESMILTDFLVKDITSEYLYNVKQKIIYFL